MADSAVRKFSSGVGPVVALILLVLVSLTLMSGATENSARFSEVYSILLLVSALGITVLGGLIGWNLVRLVGQVRAGIAGARLTARMVTIFVLLAVTPVLVVYYFSLQFLHRGIDSWFDVRIERALEDALDLGRTSLDAQMRERLNQSEIIASELSGVSNERAAGRLSDAFDLSGATELTLVSSRGNIIASSSIDSTTFVPSRPDDAILLHLRRTRSYISLDPIGGAGLRIRVVVNLPEPAPADEVRILQALYPVPERMNELAASVQSEYAKYRELAFLRQPLKMSFTLTLSLVLLLSLSGAVWAAIYSARRMVAPLQEMANVTRAVAGGDYATHVPEETRSDELGFLVESFNDMTRKLARARDETRRSQRELEEHKTYLEAVLARLSSGVLTFDHESRLFTTNKMAGQILGVEIPLEFGRSLGQMEASHPHLRPLIQVIRARTEAAEVDWREEVIIFGPSGRQILMCRGTPLPDPDHARSGQLVVFDDLTTLIEAQRNDAWSEVARRLAHEIKNPLTPIQLSAERLRHKYLANMSPDDGETLDRMTRTIVQQVEALKEMVNAFSSYARAPRMKPEIIDLNELITDVLELYRSEERGREMTTDLDPDLPRLEADADRLRQVLHNLVKNAVEAGPAEGGPRLAIRTVCVRQSPRSYIQVTVEDDGVGIPENIIERLFEPYVTTKTKGSGLGLAIVKKIVEEHGGVVWAENRAEGGARVVLRIPVVDPSPVARARERNDRVGA